MQSTAISRSLRHVWLAILCVPVVLFLATMSGCANVSLPAWKYPGYDVNRTNTFPAQWEASWHLVRLSRTALPASMPARPGLFFGDVVGDKGSEIVLVGPNRVLIYSGRGKELRSIRLEGYEHLPGFLYDADHDGKLDIVLGSRDAPRPSLSIVDGAGRVIDQYEVNSPNQDFRRFVPWLNVDSSFFIVATESWPVSPRGIIRYSVSEQKERWYFALPNEPVGLHLLKGSDGRPELLLSEYATAQGTYPFLGVERKNVFGYDSSLHLLEVGLDGRILRQHTLSSNGENLTGRLRYLLMSRKPNAPLLLRQDFGPSKRLDTYPHTPASEVSTALHILDPRTGRILDNLAFGKAHVAGIRVLPGGSEADSRIVVLLHTNAGFKLDLLDSRLRLLHSRDLQAESASLGTVLSPPSGTPTSIQSATRFFVLADNRLLLCNDNLESNQLLTDSGAKEMLVSIAPRKPGSSGPPEGRLVLVGTKLEVYAVRRN